MKEQIYAQNRVNRAVDEFILIITKDYNTDWKTISYKKYINLVRDRILKSLKQLEKEWDEE